MTSRKEVQEAEVDALLQQGREFPPPTRFAGRPTSRDGVLYEEAERESVLEGLKAKYADDAG